MDYSHLLADMSRDFTIKCMHEEFSQKPSLMFLNVLRSGGGKSVSTNALKSCLPSDLEIPRIGNFCFHSCCLNWLRIG